MARPASPCPDIPQFYSGKSIFMTGGTGFLGKILIARLLTTCPQVKNIYLLIRKKKDLNPEQRLQQLKKNVVFDEIRTKDPNQLEKLVAIPGDITKKQFDLEPGVWKQMTEVSIVFHSAATVKMQEELKLAIDQNLRSIITILELCDTLPKVDVFVHVSTAYSNAEIYKIEEKVYPPPIELGTLLNMIDRGCSQEELQKLTATKPNTYTFTKSMAEHVVERHGCTLFPSAIFRPSIVISSLQHPFPGWIENWNGPSGVIAATSAGLLRVFRTRGAAKADMIPVDIATDTLIAAAWETAVDNSSEVRVYNCCTMENPTTWGDLHLAINTLTPLYPSRRAVQYPHLTLIANRYRHRLLELIKQSLPLYTIECVKRILGVKMGPNYMQVDRNLRAMRKALEFFATRDWHFDYENVKKLRERLSDSDRINFNLDTKTINWDQMFTGFIRGTRRYVLHEPDEDLETAKRKIRILSIFYTAIKLLFYLSSLGLLTNYLLKQKFIQPCNFLLYKYILLKSDIST